MRLDFLIRRRGVDPSAESALHALRDLMHAPIVAVERGTLWRFDVEDVDDVEALQKQLQRAASRAGRYLNVNRDESTWFDAGAVPVGADAHVRGCAVSLWITRDDGCDGVARDYFQNRVSTHLTEVRRGTFYRLWTAEVDPNTARERVLEVAVTRTRRQGLLLNPHVERLEVLAVTRAANPAEVT